MSNFINVSNITYNGEEYKRIFSRDIYQMDLLRAGITPMDGLKGKTKIYKGDLGSVTQLYSCPFTPQGEASLAEAYIEPSVIKYNLENCYDTFWNTYLVSETQVSLRGGVPQTFAEWFFDKFRQKQMREYSEIFWQGDTAYTGATKPYLKAIDGIEKQLESNTGTTKITGSVFTVNNILSQVEATIKAGLDKAAADEVATDNYKVLMNHSDVDLLKMALGAVCCPNNESIFSNYAKGPDGGVIIFGYEVISTDQSRNTVIFSDPRNFVLGFDTFSDHLSWEFIDMRHTTGDNSFRIVGIANIAAGIVWPEGVVFSRP